MRFSCRASERGEVPHAGRIVQQHDLGRVDGYAGDVQRLRKNQRHQFHTDFKGSCGQKRGGAELGVVSDGKIFGRKRAAEKRKAQIPELNLAPQGRGSFFFDGGAELIHRNQERSDQDQNNQDADNNQHDAELAAHTDLQCGRVRDNFDGEIAS